MNCSVINHIPCFFVLQTRVLKSDFARYNVDDEESEDLDQDDNGWKIIHTDVFRFPQAKNLFCAILGEFRISYHSYKKFSTDS